MSRVDVVENALLCSASEVRLSFAEPSRPDAASVCLALKQGTTLAPAHCYDDRVCIHCWALTAQPPTSVNLAIAAAIHCPRTCGLWSPPAKELFLALLIITSSQTFEILQQWHCIPDASSYFLTQARTAEENSALSASTSPPANVISQDCKIAEDYA